jgi:hypothetical protein
VPICGRLLPPNQTLRLVRFPDAPIAVSPAEATAPRVF